jgi:glycosyltransferase involved in cell wall biosynthesis
LEICCNRKKKDARIIVIDSENHGVSHARNLGLQAASGEYIGFVDADDALEPDMYYGMLHRLVEEDAEIACCTDKFMDEEYSVLSQTQVKDEVLCNADIAIAFLKFKIPGGVCNKLISGKIIRDNKLRFDEKITINEDLLFFFQCAALARKCVMMNEPWYCYFKHESSASHRITPGFDIKKISHVCAAERMAENIYFNNKELYRAWKVFYSSRLIDALSYVKNYRKDEEVLGIKSMLKTKAKEFIWDFIKSGDISLKYKFYALAVLVSS